MLIAKTYLFIFLHGRAICYINSPYSNVELFLSQKYLAEMRKIKSKLKLTLNHILQPILKIIYKKNTMSMSTLTNYITQ
jgi:hypothetical protein